MRRAAYWPALACVILLGAYLRLHDLGGPSLWHDEILHVQAAESLAGQPGSWLLLGVREVGGWTENGPLYYGLQIIGLRLAPGETGARLSPALIGILALPLMALCGHRFGGRMVGLTATSLLAIAPLHVYFSREGRPYSLLMFLALALLYALLLRGSRSGRLIAYASCVAAAYTGIQAFPVLSAFFVLAAVGYLWSLSEGKGLWRSPYLHYVLAASVGLGLVYGLYMTRSQKNTLDLDQVREVAQPEQPRRSRLRSPVFESPLSAIARERFWASMTTSGHQSRLLERRSWLFLALAVVGLVSGLYRRPRDTIPTAGMFLLPAGFSIAALVLLDRWYGLRYTTSALPAFLLLVAVGIVVGAKGLGGLMARGQLKAAGESISWIVLVALLVGVAGPNVAAARIDPYSKLDWRGVAQFFDAVALEDEPVLIPNSWSRICLGYYLRQLGRSSRFVDLRESVSTGERMIAQTPRSWLLTAGFRRTNDVRTWMHGFHPVMKKAEEEMALFFHPDFATLLKTRFAAQKGEVFEERFLQMNQRFDFGGAELLLEGTGWSYPEQNSAGIRYQWAMGEVAELGLPIGQPADTVLRFRVLPFQYEGASPQTIELELNETPLARLELPGHWSEHEIEIPADTWSSGANILYLHFGRSTTPAEVNPGSGDRRRLSAAFDFLEVVMEH